MGQCVCAFILFDTVRWVFGGPELPWVANRYGTDSAFCAMLVMLQSWIPYSVVEAEKINSFKMVVDEFGDALSGLPEWLLEAGRRCQGDKL